MSKPLFAKLAPWIFAGPAVLSVIVFLYGPIIASAVLSVVDWNLLSTDVSFVGLDNYKSLFADADFRLAAGTRCFTASFSFRRRLFYR
ncbi:sugar ABC transporter permease [Ochrobactrum pseudogrignonense]|nr:sugar ABC transporter permease [Brucella pseudogrignonensis]